MARRDLIDLIKPAGLRGSIVISWANGRTRGRLECRCLRSAPTAFRSPEGPHLPPLPTDAESPYSTAMRRVAAVGLDHIG